MAYRKFYKKTRKFYKKRYPKRNGVKRMLGSAVGYLNTARKVMKWANQAKKMINSEKKYLDTVVTATNVDNTGTTYNQIINAIPEGDDYNSRDGRSILNDSIHLTYTAKVNSSATNTILKMVLVCDKKPDATTACSYNQVYGSAAVNAQINKASEGDRFVILAKRVLKLNPGASPSITGDIYYKLNGVHTKYDGTGSTIGDVEKNAYFVIAVSDEATNYPTLAFTSRFSWYDN